MPSQKKEFSYPEYNGELLLQLAYGTFLSLGWTPQYAGPGILLGYTPGNWKKNTDEITVETGDGLLNITSSLVHGEAFDIYGRNKKHISEFINAFDKIRNSSPDPEWATAVEQLKSKTIEVANQETKQAEEITRVMGLPGYQLVITYSIIALNAVVFILMAINGAGIFDTNGLVHIQWGSNFTALTLSGDWWRLITNVFIHFGILHIIMNSYALYMAGVYLEPMLGKIKFSVAYLCTGVLASIASLWWHKEGVNSAGASGAIFGLYGVFLALLFTNLIPKKTRTSLLQTIGVFVVYNLAYGMKSGVDNAAHVGGLLSGLVIGLIYFPGLKKGVEENKNLFSAFAITAATIAFAWIYLNGASSSLTESQVKEARNLIQITAYKDGEKLIEKINEVAAIEEIALAPLNDTTLSNAELAKKLNEISVKEWDKAAAILAEAKNYRISERDKKQVELLTGYVLARKEEIKIIERIAEAEKQEDYDLLSGIREKISGLITKLKELK